MARPRSSAATVVELHPATTPPLPDTAVADGYNPAVPVAEVQANPRNVRRDLGDLDELVASIAAVGIRHPLTVTPVSQVGQDGHRYLLVDGHRRYAAAVEAGLTEVPAIVRTDLAGDVDVILEMLRAGLLQQQLTPIEEAVAYEQLQLLGLRPADIARRVGRSTSTVERRLHLMDLPERVRERVHTRAMTLDEAAVIAEFGDLVERWPAARDWVKKLEENAGSNDWTYMVASARTAWQGEQKRQAARALVAALGVQLLPGGGYDREWRHVQRTWYTEAELATAASAEGEQVAGIDEVPTEARAHLGCPDAAAQVSLGGYVTWFCLRPEQHTPVRGPGAPADDAGDVVDEQLGDSPTVGAVPYREAPSAASVQSALRSAWRDHEEASCGAAAAARRQWIRETLLPGKKALTAAQTDALCRYVARQLARYVLEVDVYRWVEWADVDLSSDIDSDTDRELAEHIDSTARPARVLLAALAGESEYLIGRAIAWVDREGPAVDARLWLGLLQAFGYEPCSWEAQYLAEPTGSCRVCGCTEDAACTDDPLSACWWVAPDLCSSCVTKALAAAQEGGEPGAGG